MSVVSYQQAYRVAQTQFSTNRSTVDWGKGRNPCDWARSGGSFYKAADAASNSWSIHFSTHFRTPCTSPSISNTTGHPTLRSGTATTMSGQSTRSLSPPVPLSAEAAPGVLPRVTLSPSEHREDHPEVAAIKAGIPSHDDWPDWLLALDPVLEDDHGQPVGHGWRFTALFTPPPDSEYGGRQAYRVNINFREGTYFPSVRWTQLIRHSQIPEHGYVERHLLEMNTDRHQPVVAGVLDVLVTCRRMLSAPLPAAPEDDPPDADIVHFWKHHEIACTCLLGKLLPCSFSIYQDMPLWEQKQALMTVRGRIVQENSLAFFAAAAAERERQNTINAWRPRTLQPQLYEQERGPAAIAAWRMQWLHEDLCRALAASPQDKHETLKNLVTCEAPGVYSFPMFTVQTCEAFINELQSERPGTAFLYSQTDPPLHYITTPAYKAMPTIPPRLRGF